MAGRVLRDSRGRFKGSTGGWGSGRIKSPFANSASRRKVVRHTVKQAAFAGGKGAARAIARGSYRGIKSGAARGLGAGVVAFGINRSLGIKTGPNLANVAKIAATGAATGAVLGGVTGAVRAGPGRAFKSSASASVALGVSNRQRAAKARAKAVAGQKINATIAKRRRR